MVKISSFLVLDSSQVSASILPNGHVCFIYERKVYIWKLKKALKVSSRGRCLAWDRLATCLMAPFQNIQCYELTLPSSRAPIRPECISVECHNNRDYVAICVTSEGIIRYWPTILKELLCVDAKFDLASGDEVANVTCLSVSTVSIATIPILWSSFNLSGRSFQGELLFDHHRKWILMELSHRLKWRKSKQGTSGPSLHCHLGHFHSKPMVFFQDHACLQTNRLVVWPVLQREPTHDLSHFRRFSAQQEQPGEPQRLPTLSSGRLELKWRLIPKNFKCSLKYPDSNEIYCLVDKNLEKWRINSDNTLSVSSSFGAILTVHLGLKLYFVLEVGHSNERGEALQRQLFDAKPRLDPNQPGPSSRFHHQVSLSRSCSWCLSW